MRLIRLIPYLAIPYMLFAFFRLANLQAGPSHYIQNVWYQDFFSSLAASRHLSIQTFSQAKRPFYYYGNTLAYLEDTSEIQHIIRKERNVYFSANAQFYLSYNKTGQTLTLYERTGRKKWVLNNPGTGILSPHGNLIAIITTDNTTITLFNPSREQIMPSTYLGSFITDIGFSQENDSFAVTTIEGKIYYYQPFTQQLEQWEVPQSRYTYAKSLTLSKSGQSLAVLSGLEPERLTLYTIAVPQNSSPLASEQNTPPTPNTALPSTISQQWSIPTGLSQRKKNSMFIDEINNQLVDLRAHQLVFSHLKNGSTLYQTNLISQAEALEDPIAYTVFDNAPTRILAASYIGADTHVQLFSTDRYDLLWEQTFTKNVPLDVELIAENDYLVIIITLSSGVYRYRLWQ